MGQSSTYRVRWRSAIGDLELLQAMLPTIALPLGRARKYEDICEDVSLVAPGVSIAGLVPTDDAREPTYWSFDGTDFTFTADLLNPGFRHDASMFSEVGEPSRETALLDALSATCGAPEGTIVGAWMNDHSDHWHPMVFLGGRVTKGFVSYRDTRYGEGHSVQHDGRLPDGLTLDEHGTVTIPVKALATA